MIYFSGLSVQDLWATELKCAVWRALLEKYFWYFERLVINVLCVLRFLDSNGNLAILIERLQLIYTGFWYGERAAALSCISCEECYYLLPGSLVYYGTLSFELIQHCRANAYPHLIMSQFKKNRLPTFNFQRVKFAVLMRY